MIGRGHEAPCAPPAALFPAEVHPARLDQIVEHFRPFGRNPRLRETDKSLKTLYYRGDQPLARKVLLPRVTYSPRR